MASLYHNCAQEVMLLSAISSQYISPLKHQQDAN